MQEKEGQSIVMYWEIQGTKKQEIVNVNGLQVLEKMQEFHISQVCPVSC